jgi:peptide/nickel transport system permease protein
LVLSYAVTVLVLVTLNFFLPRAMPGGPLSTFQGMGGAALEVDASTRAAVAEHYGFDRPLLTQYGSYLAGLARGDLGTSLRYSEPVAEVVAERLPWTLLLMGAAIGLASAVSLLAGTHSGWRRGRGVDRGLLGLFMGIRNFPVYFLASLGVFVFGVKLGWVPISGSVSPFAGATGSLGHVLDVAHHLVLPAAVLAVPFAASQYLVMRAGMVGELGSAYLLLGRAKGLGPRRLKYAYAARNALLPVVTVAGLQIGFAVTGAIFVETVFAYPGMGRLVQDAVAFRDYPTLQGCFLVLTLTVLTANFVVDAVYARLDPRTSA